MDVVRGWWIDVSGGGRRCGGECFGDGVWDLSVDEGRNVCGNGLGMVASCAAIGYGYRRDIYRAGLNAKWEVYVLSTAELALWYRPYP